MGITHLSGLQVAGVPTMGVGGSLPLGKNYLFVDSAYGSDGNTGTEMTSALATLDSAFAKCTANKGYIIVVLPNHEETITGAAGIAHDVAGVSVIGLGVGNQRPRFLMDAGTSVTYAISAADAYVENLVFAAGHADIVACFDITATGAHLHKLEFVENTTAENFLTEIKATSTTDNNADGLTVTECRSIGIDSAHLEFIEVNADLDRLQVHNNYVCQIGSTAGALILCATGKDLTNCFVSWNFVQHAMTANDLLVDNDTTANTGIIAHNRCRHADVTGAHSLIDCDGVGLFDNLSTSTNTTSGFVLPAIDVDL